MFAGKLFIIIILFHTVHIVYLGNKHLTKKWIDSLFSCLFFGLYFCFGYHFQCEYIGAFRNLVSITKDSKIITITIQCAHKITNDNRIYQIIVL